MSPSSKSTMLVELAYANFESENRTARLMKMETKEEVLSKVFKDGSFKASRRQRLLDTCTVKKRTEQYALFSLAGLHRLLSKIAMSTIAEQKERKEIGQAQKRWLKTVEGSEALQKSRWMIRADISPISFEEYNCKEEVIAKEERFFAEGFFCYSRLLCRTEY